MSLFRIKSLSPIALGLVLAAQASLSYAQSSNVAVESSSSKKSTKLAHTTKSTPPAQASSASISAQLDKIASSFYLANQPGATVIVSKEGKILLRKGYGLANIQAQETMRAEHVMRLGSITKQFTAVAILQLVDAGKIGLQDSITRYLPDFPESAKGVTIEHLLTHTSGIPSYTGKPGFMASASKDLSVQEMIDTFKNDALEFEPGTEWKYNNSGYFLLGAIIEKVSGETYANYLAQHVFTPLGMQHTAYENYERAPQIKAFGYSKDADTFEAATKISMTQPYAAGALCSTVDDLAKWDAAIQAGKLLKADSWRRALTPYILKNGQSTNYAYGWGVGQFEGRQMYSHGGGIPGFSTFALSMPKEHLYVAVLTNADGGLAQPEMVATRLAASAIGKPIPDFKAIHLDQKALDRFVGVYRIDDKNRRYIVRDNDKLVMTRTNGPRTVLQPYSANGFFKDNNSLLRLEFTQADNGDVNNLIVYQNGTVTSHARLDEAMPDATKALKAQKAIEMSAEQFATFAGDYQIQANFVLNVRREGERFVTQATGQGPVNIFPVSADTFDAPDVGGQLKFEKDADGKVTQLILTQGGRQIPAKKIK